MVGESSHFLSTSNLYEPDKHRVLGYVDLWMAKGGHSRPGVLVALLEQRLCEYHHSKHCVAFATGFWSLVACLRLKALSAPEVIIPSFTYRRLADVVFWAGKTPRFVDVDPATLAISPKAVERAISSKTGAILAVHPIVNCCDVGTLQGIAHDHRVPIVFDAVESVHETCEGRRVGSLGGAEVFSLHASKLINGLEGGYVCSDDPEFVARLRRFKTHDATSASLQEPGSWIPSEMPDLHAAFALAGLDEIDLNVSHNQRIYRAYQARLKTVPGIRLRAFDEAEQTSFKNIVAELTGRSSCSRDSLVEQLNHNGMLARAHYSPPLHTRSYEFPVSCPDALPVTESVAARFINLPCGFRMKEGDVSSVVDVIEKSLSMDSGG